jgi:hypothetical protein
MLMIRRLSHIDSFKYIEQFRMTEGNAPLGCHEMTHMAANRKGSTFESLARYPISREIPHQNLDHRTPSVHEDKRIATEWITMEKIHDQSRETIGALAHIRYCTGQEDTLVVRDA